MLGCHFPPKFPNPRTLQWSELRAGAADTGSVPGPARRARQPSPWLPAGTADTPPGENTDPSPPVILTPFTWTSNSESLERINSICEINGSFDLWTLINEWVTWVKTSVCFAYQIYPLSTFVPICSCKQGLCQRPLQRRYDRLPLVSSGGIRSTYQPWQQ